VGQVRVVVLADTHLRDGVARRLPAAVLRALERADLVLHAGDVVGAAALSELESLAPTVAVLGNNDHELLGRLPAAAELELAGMRIAMTHDSGARLGRERRLHERFPDAQLVVFGHSHAPVNEEGIAGQRLFNPGSPTQRRAQPRASFGRLELAEARIVHLEVELL
jgi:uncharacterized protein